MSNVFIGLGLTRDDGQFAIDDRPEVIALLNDTMMRIDGNTGPYGTTKYLLESIKLENPKASFRFEWKPPEKYTKTFVELKESKTRAGSKQKFTLNLRFFGKENGKITWTLNATAKDSTVYNVLKAGNSSNPIQTVDIQCKDFDYK